MAEIGRRKFGGTVQLGRDECMRGRRQKRVIVKWLKNGNRIDPGTYINMTLLHTVGHVGVWERKVGPVKVKHDSDATDVESMSCIR